MKNSLLTLFTVILTTHSALAWRDLETGTYLTRDPAGFIDGPNLYTYVTQNPWSYFDPYGLETYRTRGSEEGPDEEYKYTETTSDLYTELGLDPDKGVEMKGTKLQGEHIISVRQGDNVRYGWARKDSEGNEIGTIWSDNFDEFFGHIEYGIPWTANAKEGNIQNLIGIIPAPEGANTARQVSRNVTAAIRSAQARKMAATRELGKKALKNATKVDDPFKLGSSDELTIGFVDKAGKIVGKPAKTSIHAEKILGHDDLAAQMGLKVVNEQIEGGIVGFSVSKSSKGKIFVAPSGFFPGLSQEQAAALSKLFQ